jgi:molecular chaperone DnaK (HSP70)
MKLGIDFGTTRIVAAASDRGNFPVIYFENPEGGSNDWFPPLLAARGGEILFGWEAWAVQQDPTATVVRSLKRVLADSGAGTAIGIGSRTVPLLELLNGIASAFRNALAEKSTLDLKAGEPLEAMLGVPAHANSNQRFLTVEAFRSAGFDVLGLLNEPSAASIEFGHQHSNTPKIKDRILVYDLGGGTFDASLVELTEQSHAVIATESIASLGGDDFDIVLSEMACPRSDLTQAEMFLLHEECRQKKESINPNTRKVSIDLDAVREGLGTVAIPIGEFYEPCGAMLEETLNAVDDLIVNEESLEAFYVTGGGSELPLVARALRERYGRRVRRCAYTRSATAIGLAIQACEQSGYVLREQFTRYFGVWRESDNGRVIDFDPLFPKGLELPCAGDPPRSQARHYEAMHNIGDFRYIECTHLDPAGQPAGDITVWDEIRFPFDPDLKDVAELAGQPVYYMPLGQQVEEQYSCDAGGTVMVTISNLTSGYIREYKLGRWAGKESTVVPGTKKRAPARKRRATV